MSTVKKDFSSNSTNLCITCNKCNVQVPVTTYYFATEQELLDENKLLHSKLEKLKQV